MSFDKRNLALPVIMAVATTIMLNAVMGQDGQHPAPIGKSESHVKVARVKKPVAIDSGRLTRKVTKPVKVIAVKPKRAGDAIGKLLGHVNKTSAPAKAPLEDVQEVRFVQMRLAQLGYDVGPIDGVMGQKTRDAIKKFEKTRKIPVTGELSRALLGALSRKASLASLATSPRFDII